MSEVRSAIPAPSRLRSIPIERGPPDAGASAPLRGLPRPLTSLIGRDAEVAVVRALLLDDGVRLLTLTGPGGVGKTRLALRIAEDVAAAFSDGVVFVPLAAIADPDLVLPTIARELGLREIDVLSPLDLIADFLRQRRLLLVLDNFEQVRPAAAHLATLLADCRDLTILVTSRVPLHVSGEQRFPVSPLALPPTPITHHPSSAVELFVARAQAVDPAFALAADNVVTLAAICRRLDGLPLAIELAAAQVRIFSPDALLARLTPALPLLTDGPEDAPHRLRTMRQAITWSYDLLSPAEQSLFRRLAVFVGGFTLDAAEWVGGRGTDDAFDLIVSLIDKSLVQRTSGPPGQTRYAMLETVREFGLEALAMTGDGPAVHDALAKWCLAFAARAEPELAGPDYAAWVARIEAELGNIRAAHAWLRERGDAEQELRLGGALGWLWSSGGHCEEGRNLFAQLIAMPGATAAPAALAKVLHSAGDADQWRGYLDQAQEHFEQALAIFRGIDDRRGVVAMLRGLGSVAIDRGDLDDADALLREVLALAPGAGAAWEAASAANLLAVMAYTRGDYATAIRLGEEAVAGWQDLADTGHVATALANLARAALASDDPARAAAAAQAVLAHVPAAGDDMVVCDCFEIAAGFAEMAAEPLRAARLLAASDAMQQRLDMQRWPAFQALFERMVMAARQALGEPRFAAAWAAGQAMLVDEATTDVLAVLHPEARVARPAVSAGTGPDALTPREREILRLLVVGQTDKEIAAALGISRYTVSQHVATIRGKLAAPSRAAAAAIAVRGGLDAR